jgi:hypothetical protein
LIECHQDGRYRPRNSSAGRRAAFWWSEESKLSKKLLIDNLFMLKPEGSESKLKLWQRLGALPVFCFLGVLVSTTAASAQGTTEFTLSAATLSPQAIVPGGTSSTSLTIGSVNGFAGTVNLGCAVTATQMVTDAPVCTVSPSSVTPPATATATITSQGATTTVGYDVTITGTGPTTTYTTPPLGLTVLAVTPQFTLAIETAMSPNSVPAGNASQGVISVNPVNGYSTPPGGGITLYCSSVTPLVTIPPTCSFAYANNKDLQLVDTPANVTLTIKTAGTTVIGAAPHPRSFYALWLSIPVLGLVGVGAAVGGKRSTKAFAVLTIFLVSGCLLLLPACVNQLSNGTVGTPNGITPADTYTFTIVGVDSNGVVSSNTGTSTGPTMTLTVTAPPKT